MRMICIGNNIGDYRRNMNSQRNIVEYVLCFFVSAFYIETDIYVEGQKSCVRNRRILILDDNSMKDGGYNLHFPCLICTFMRVTYRRLVVSITLHIIDGLHPKVREIEHMQ